MEKKTMKTLTYGDVTYEITDEYARSRVDFLDGGVKTEIPVTLFASGWVGDAAPYTYSVTIEGHKNTTDIINLLLGDDITDEQALEVSSANIIRAEWANETTLVLYAYGLKPISNVPIKIYINVPLSDAYGEENIVLHASNWAGTSAPYTQAVTIKGHKNTTDVVSLMVGDDMSTDQISALQAANIIRSEWSDETTLVLYAYGAKPKIDASVKIYVAAPFGLSGGAEGYSKAEVDALIEHNNKVVVNDAVAVANAIASYLAFVENKTVDIVDAAFGKNTEDLISGVGMALAMYARYKDPTIDIYYTFKNLIECKSLVDVAVNEEAMEELYSNEHLVALISPSEYVNNALTCTPAYITAMKSDREMFEEAVANVNIVNSIRNSATARAIFNKNRIRILATGNVSWTVPNDWPTDFIHVQLIGGGGQNAAGTKADCGEYVQGFINVTPGQVITGSIGIGANTVFGGLIAKKGEGASQSGAWLVKASNGGNESVYSTSYRSYGGYGGFEGGQGQNGKNNSDHISSNGNSNNCGKGDDTLGYCEGTAGSGNGFGVATNGGGGGAAGSNYTSEKGSTGAGGGGGYGGGPAYRHYKESSGWVYDSVQSGVTGGSGAIVITCPDGYVPQNVVYNKVNGVVAWRRDENIFNDF